MEGYPSSTRCGTLHTTLLDKCAREPGGIEPPPGRERVRGFLARRNAAHGDQPVERVVEAVPDQPLEPRVAAGTFATEFVPRAVAPDHAGREQHRTAGPRPLFAYDRDDAELTEARRGHEAGHAGPRDDDGHVKENVGLCSTYSMRTRSGPHRNTAYVFAASTTDSTSIPRSSASAMCASAESTSTAR